MQVRSLGQEDPLGEGMTIHSRILTWRIPWTEEPNRLQSIGSHRVVRDWSDSACKHTYSYYSRVMTIDLVHFSPSYSFIKKKGKKALNCVFVQNKNPISPIIVPKVLDPNLSMYQIFNQHSLSEQMNTCSQSSCLVLPLFLLSFLPFSLSFSLISEFQRLYFLPGTVMSDRESKTNFILGKSYIKTRIKKRTLV